MGIGSIIARAMVSGVIQAAKEVAREDERLTLLNQRTEHWREVAASVAENFVTPLSDSERMTPKESGKLSGLYAQMNAQVLLFNENKNQNRNIAENEKIFRGLTVDMKRATIIAMKLCQKYEVYSDIESVSYDGRRKMIMLNGKDLYCLM